MYFADEIRPLDEIAPTKGRVSKKELEMAAQLIESFSGSFKPEQYEDTHRDALHAIVDIPGRADMSKKELVKALKA